MNLSAIILTGGKSRRMGQDKALLVFESHSLLQRAVSLCQASCRHVVISSNTSTHTMGDIPLIADEIPDCGPMGGLYSCLKNTPTTWSFLLSVDAPFVPPAFINYLWQNTHGYEAVVPVHQNGKEPLVALYHKNILGMLEQCLQASEYKMHSLLQQINTHFVKADKWVQQYPNIFCNLNRPEDLQL